MVNINDRIGNYVLIEEINSGSFGSVYKARHHFLEDIIVAIKVLHPHLIAEHNLEQFFQEAQLLYKLKHRYILPILDAGTHEKSPYIIMEYASRGSLHDRLKQFKGKPLSSDEAIKILIQVGNALQHAHAQNVTHRDLKPENILLNANGDVLLADFGLALVLESGRTKQVGLGGTVYYMAPEQFGEEASMKSDLYALGCIAYEMLAGRRPFVVEYPTIERMWYQHAHVAPVPPRQYNPAIPEHIEQTILTAMAKDRKNRHADVATFMATLQAFPKPKKTKEHWLDEGVTYSKEKRYTKALAAFEQAILLDPNYAIAYRNKGNVFSDQKRYGEAITAYEEAIKYDPNYARAYSSKGAALNELQQYEEAIAAYEEAIKRDAAFAVPHNGKGDALYDLKRYAEAIVAYEEAIRRDAAFAVPHSGKGDALKELKRYVEAIRAYEEAIRRDVTYAYPHSGKGDIFYDLKRYVEAIRAYEEAIRRDATYAYPHKGKGDALDELNRCDEALAAYDQAIRIDPNYADAYHNKGYVLNRIGRKEEAKIAFARAKELGHTG